jgi:hypothetical protein
MSNDVTPRSDLEGAIAKAFAHLDAVQPETNEYAATVDQLTKLYKLREVDHKIDSSTRVSKDTLAIVGANLAGIVLILGHERVNVIASKALGFVMKLR